MGGIGLSLDCYFNHAKSKSEHTKTYLQNMFLTQAPRMCKSVKYRGSGFLSLLR